MDAGGARGIDLAKLAHELKTPLSAIAAASEIMKEGRFGDIGNDRYAGYIADIHASARHALDLVERMLDRRGEGASPRAADMRWEEIALDAFAGACLSTVRPLAAAKSLTISESHAAPPARITADATTLKQIVLNLVANAIKFTPPGGTISVSTTAHGSGSVALVVQDTGPGMSEEAIAEALQPVPSEVPQMRNGGGLGLGLPMTRALAEALGATLSIDSPPGGGTRAIVTFAV
jgi:signal transduction histidine kinase